MTIWEVKRQCKGISICYLQLLIQNHPLLGVVFLATAINHCHSTSVFGLGQLLMELAAIFSGGV